jgi:hypothetical protein
MSNNNHIPDPKDPKPASCKHGTTLDLNMGCCHMDSSNSAKEFCTIATQWPRNGHAMATQWPRNDGHAMAMQWSKNECQQLPVGSCNSPDIFQEKMNDPLADPDTVRVHVDDILHVTKGLWWEDHLTGLKQVFCRLQQAGLKVNANSWMPVMRSKPIVMSQFLKIMSVTWHASLILPAD